MTEPSARFRPERVGRIDRRVDLRRVCALVCVLLSCSSQPPAGHMVAGEPSAAVDSAAPARSNAVVENSASPVPQASASAASVATQADPEGPIAIVGNAAGPAELAIDGELSEWGELPVSSVVPVLTDQGLLLAGRVAGATDRGVWIWFDSGPAHVPPPLGLSYELVLATERQLEDFGSEFVATYMVSSTGILRTDVKGSVKDGRVAWKDDGGGVATFEALIPPSALPLFFCPSAMARLLAARVVSGDLSTDGKASNVESFDNQVWQLRMHPTDPLRAGGCKLYSPGGYQPGTGDPWVTLQVRGNRVVRGTAPLFTLETKCGALEIVRVFPDLIAARLPDGTIGDAGPAGKVLGCVPRPAGPSPPEFFVMAYHPGGVDQTPGFEVWAIGPKGEVGPVPIEPAPVTWSAVSPFHDPSWKTFGLAGVAETDAGKKALRLTWSWDAATSGYKLGSGTGP